MKKLAIIFVLSVLGPSLALAWLALRSLKHQEMVVQSQLALLHQGRTDAVAGDLRVAMDDIRSYFGTLVDDMVDEVGPGEELYHGFDQMIRSRWGQAWAGCVITEKWEWVAPRISGGDPRAQAFAVSNAGFLTNTTAAQVYQAPLPTGNVIQIEKMEANDSKGSVGRVRLVTSYSHDQESAEIDLQERKQPQEESKEASADESGDMPANAAPAADLLKKSADAPEVRSKVGLVPQKLRSVNLPTETAPDPLTSSRLEPVEANGGPVTASGDSTLMEATPGADLPSPAAASPPTTEQGAVTHVQSQRRIEPLAQLSAGGWDRAATVAQRALGFDDRGLNLSRYQAASGEVQDIIGNQPEGALSRFLPDGLHVLLWYRHPRINSHIFWVELDLKEIRRDLAEVIELAAQGSSPTQEQACLALLDSDSKPVAMSEPGFSTDWRKPFVASEVGEILPYWEVAAYLLNPAQVASSARTARLTLWLLVPILLAAIGFGSLLVFRDVGREMHAARQKTDFVSNVSHELKTPLTSIRMFSDLLSGNREGSAPLDPEKVGSYAGVISTEAARLTRLINNLLDFSRMERGEKKYDRTDFDAVELASEVMENYRIQIESEGLSLSFQDRIGSPVMIHGDRDALAQVLLNLISNAEKYGASGGVIEVVASRSGDGQWIELSVLDCGAGVPRRETERIFEKFYRVDDSLSTGIQGSGLGLTLARQIARAHGGDVAFCDREDGKSGSCFVLRLPTSQQTAPS